MRVIILTKGLYYSLSNCVKSSVDVLKSATALTISYYISS